jgi:DNA-binding protein H-NS
MSSFLNMSEAPNASTARLVFDSSDTDDDIPQFLRKAKPVEYREPGDEYEEPEIKQPVDPSSVFKEITHQINEAPAAISEPETEVENMPDLPPSTEADETAIEAAIEAAASNLDGLSVEELQRQQEEIDRKIREKREAEKRGVIEQIKAVVDMYKIPVDELVEALGGMKVKRKGVKAVQKYQDPKTGATWSGRGKEPIWIRGKDRRKFEIKP